jgi:hypothetical protein
MPFGEGRQIWLRFPNSWQAKAVSLVETMARAALLLQFRPGPRLHREALAQIWPLTCSRLRDWHH